jgi:hypothetical protein
MPTALKDVVIPLNLASLMACSSYSNISMTLINMSSSGWWLGPSRRELRKIIESGWKSDVKKARGLDGEIESVFRERERLRG